VEVLVELAAEVQESLGLLVAQRQRGFRIACPLQQTLDETSHRRVIDNVEREAAQGAETGEAARQFVLGDAACPVGVERIGCRQAV
jgi:hypothetical protein